MIYTLRLFPISPAYPHTCRQLTDMDRKGHPTAAIVRMLGEYGPLYASLKLRSKPLGCWRRLSWEQGQLPFAAPQYLTQQGLGALCFCPWETSGCACDTGQRLPESLLLLAVRHWARADGAPQKFLIICEIKDLF